MIILDIPPLNSGREYYARPHDSSDGFPLYIGFAILIFIIYITIRVWREIQRDKLREARESTLKTKKPKQKSKRIRNQKKSQSSGS